MNISAEKLDSWLLDESDTINDLTLVVYDYLPRTHLLHRKLMNGLKVELDYDRVGWSKSGFVYRLIKKAHA